MKEIEVKILNIHTGQVREKLQQLEAKKKFAGEIVRVTFDFPDRRLKQNHELLRVRKIGDETTLCFKGKKEYEDTVKIREELEVTTSSFENTVKILELLGFQKINENKKYRESYHIGKAKFEIDQWGNIPHFLEIEAPSKKEVIQW